MEELVMPDLAQNDLSSKGRMQVKIPRLIEILGTYLYSNAEVAIREMLQNAHDSIVKREVVDRLAFDGGRIEVDFDEFNRTLRISDDGVGMTREEIENYLATIGVGGTAQFKDTVESRDKEAAKQLIGQFGLGMLSAFIVAERVEIVTKSYRTGSSALRWECEGSEEYGLIATQKETPGTDVILHLKRANQIKDETLRAEILSLLNERNLNRIITTYADFLRIPIFLRGTQVNTINPPWHNPEATSAEFAEYIQKRFPDSGVLEVLPLNERRDEIEVSGVLFIPRGKALPMLSEYGKLDIYIRRVFNGKDVPDLLPEWAKFVLGVIDSPSLTPTVSRESVVRDRNFAVVSQLLGLRIMNFLKDLALRDQRQFREVITSHNLIIKAKAVASDDKEFFDLVSDIVLFDSSEGKISLPKYFEKLSTAASSNLGNIEAKTIYFFDEESSGAQEKVLFKARGIPVLDARYGAEEAFLRKYVDFNDEYQLRRLEATEESIFKEDTDPGWARLKYLYNTGLGLPIEARVGHFEPKDMPAVLLPKYSKGSRERLQGLADAEGLSPAIREFFRGLNTELSIHRQLPVLYLNAHNVAVQKLNELAQRDAGMDALRIAMATLYNNAVMFGGFDVLQAEAVQQIFETNTRAVEKLASMALEFDDKEKDLAAKVDRKAKELAVEPRSAAESVTLTPYRSCFLAMPFKSEFTPLQEQLRTFLLKEYGIKLVSADKEIISFDLFENINNQIRQCHFGIAEITDNNRNVLIELGLMLGAMKQAILLVDTSKQPNIPADIQHKLFVPYKRTEVTHDAIEFPGLENGLRKVMKPILNDIRSLKVAEKWDEPV
jgi:molecular chaperone HtpG